MSRFVGPPGPPGPPGAAGAAGAGLDLTYDALIASSPGGVPVCGWACQDASMASAIAATYGAVNLSTLTGVTRETANPLYPGAVAAKTDGTAGSKAQSSAVPTGVTGVHFPFSYEAWVFVPAGTGKKGMAFAISKDTTTFEGFGIGVGGANYAANTETDNYATVWKAGVNNALGVTGALGNSDFASTAQGAHFSRIGLKGRWHHLAITVNLTNDTDIQFYLNGEPYASRLVFGDASHGAFTSAARATLFNDGAASATPSAGLMVAHAYFYDYPLARADIRERVDLVRLLNQIG